MFLNRLPTELLQKIADELPRIEDMNGLSRVDRECYRKINSSVYQRDARLGSCALLWAGKYGRLETAQQSVAAGGRIGNTTGIFRSTPLHIAASFGQVEMARFLIKHGADLFAECTNGLTPLHFAMLKGHVEMVQTLLEAGANPNATSGSIQFTPLHIACFSGRAIMVAILLHHGANVQAKDKNGMTALDWAVRGIIGLGGRCKSPIVGWYEQRSVKITATELSRQKHCNCSEALSVVKALVAKHAVRRMSDEEYMDLLWFMETTMCVNGREGGWPAGLHHKRVPREELLALIKNARSAGSDCTIQ